MNPDISLFDENESQARSYCRRFPRVFTHAKGSSMFDAQGNEYLDFLACAGALNYGHNPPAVKAALLEYMLRDGIQGALDFHTEAKARFIQAFRQLILEPRGMAYRLQFTAPTGTSVIESAVKLARKVTRRKDVVAFTNGFHGMSGTSLGLTGHAYHRQEVQDRHVTRMPYEGYPGNAFDTVAYLRMLLSDPGSGIDRPAAVVLETVQGEGGVNIASAKWLQDLRALTRELGILLIVDDIQAGCGRTGRFFSFEFAGIEPDLVCLSKSISGYGLPMSLLLIRPEHDQWEPGEDNGTFRGNTLAFVAARAALVEYWSDVSLQQAVQAKGEIVMNALRQLMAESPQAIKSVRGRGMFCGVEFFDPTLAREVAESCFASHLIVERCGPNDEVIKLFPPLTINLTALHRGLDILSAALSMCLAQRSPHAPEADVREQRAA